ncbi:MAG: hypothetical protein V4510_00365 [bacterium]
MRNFIVCGICGAVVVSHPVTVTQHRLWHNKHIDGKTEAFAAFSLLEAADFPAAKFRVTEEE